jgi:hypothetical protein
MEKNILLSILKVLLHLTMNIIIHRSRPGARGIRRNISRSDDIFRGALVLNQYLSNTSIGTTVIYISSATLPRIPEKLSLG